MTASAGTPELGDAFGLALLDMAAGRPEPTVIERDDGFIGIDATDYVASLDDLAHWALDRAVGRVLDVGAGAGRASLALQERGQDVVALDLSPGAILACRRRGVRAVYLGSVERAAAEATLGTFDSALLLGSNLSLLGSPAAAAGFLAALGDLLRPGGRDTSPFGSGISNWPLTGSTGSRCPRQSWPGSPARPAGGSPSCGLALSTR
jgi:SAM-dependent methyltransferase